MGTKDRREREKQVLRAKILDAARELFLSEGYEATSMRKIADRIEYSPTALYLHFKDKDELLHEMCRCDFGVLAERARKLARVADPVERLRRLALEYIEFALQYPNHFRLMFMTPLPGHYPDEEDLERMKNPDEESYAFLLKTVREALASKRFKPEYKDPELVAQAMWAVVHGVAAIHVVRSAEEWVNLRPPKRVTQLAVDAFLSGLMKKQDK
jgi:AcrR family transcriptional regulator